MAPAISYWPLWLSITALIVQDGQCIVYPNPMKCLKNHDAHLDCIVTYMDGYTLDLLDLHTMIPKETEELTIFCTSEYDNYLSVSAFGHLTKLRKLVFWNCKFLKFPGYGLKGLPNLQNLSFHLVRPTFYFSTGYGGLSPLFEDVTYCSIDLLCSLTLLVELTVTGHQLTSVNQVLPCSFTVCCQRLSNLNFSENLIETLFESTFDGLDGVEILDLSNNRIEVLNPTTFIKLSHLRRLILTKNPLREVSLNIFKANVELSAIEFAYDDPQFVGVVPDIFTSLGRWRRQRNFHGECTEYTGLDDENLEFIRNITSLSMCLRNLSYSNPNFISNLVNLKQLTLAYFDNETDESLEANVTPPFMKLVLAERTNLTHMTIACNGLKLYPKMFQNFSTLTHLTLYGMTENLQMGVFEGLHKLKVLKLHISYVLGNSSFLIQDKPNHLSELQTLHVIGNHNKLPPNGLQYVSIIRQVTASNVGYVPTTLCGRKNSFSLTKVHLNFNGIVEVRKSNFENCRKLLVLDMSYNRISSLIDPTLLAEIPFLNSSAGAFSSLQNLTHLILIANEIQSLDLCILPEALLHVDLSDNNISVLSDINNVSSRLPLQSLSLFNNPIYSFESKIFPSNLRQIYLGQDWSNQHYQMLPSLNIGTDSFFNIQNLEVLFLNHRSTLNFRWVTRPSTLEVHFATKTVDDFHMFLFHDNKTFQHTFCQYNVDYQFKFSPEKGDMDWFPVTILNCSNVNLQEFPALYPTTVAFMVENLYLDGNNLSMVPSYCLRNLGMNVKILYLNNSHISYVETYAFHTTGLQELHLEFNEISLIPAGTMPPTLKMLFLQNNQIGIDIFFTLNHNRWLQTLRLENNLITAIAVGILCNGHGDLSREIYLQNNQLESFDMESIATCQSLQILVLRNNSIQRLYNDNQPHWAPPQSRTDVSPVVDLSYNKLSNFSLSVIAELGIKTLDLRGNAIKKLETYNVNRVKLRLFVKQSQKIYLNDNFLTVLNGDEFISRHNFTELKVLSLANNSLQSIDKATFRNMVSLQTLDLSGNQMATFNATIFDQLVNLKRLYLNNNEIEYLSDEFQHLLQLQVLHLNDNFLSNLRMESFQNLRYLEVLFLHNNKLTSPELWALPKSLLTVNLLNNPLTCDCSFIVEFSKWLNDMKLNKEGIVQVSHCMRDHQWVSLIDFDYSICQISYELPLGIGMGVLLFLFLALCLLYYKRIEMQVWVYSRYGVRLFYKNEEADKRFDVFIAYSSHDELFVVNDLLPGLKEYRICIHFKDFLPGAFITEAVAEAVDNSCRTLLVFSHRFLQSPWCKWEFKVAHNKTLEDRCCRLILLLLEDVDENTMDNEMKAYLKTNTYLRWDDGMFWQKLKFALPDVVQNEPGVDRRMLFELQDINR